METEPTYTIKQTAGRTGMTEDTIRYYEKIALLPRAERKDNGHRIYRQKDVDTLRLIACLKKTGMPLDEMRPFLTVSTDADPAEYPALVERMKSHREHIVSQIDSLQQVVDFIDMKLKEGRYRQDCSEGRQVGVSNHMRGAPIPKLVSSVEGSSFPASAATADFLEIN